MFFKDCAYILSNLLWTFRIQGQLLCAASQWLVSLFPNLSYRYLQLPIYLFKYFCLSFYSRNGNNITNFPWGCCGIIFYVFNSQLGFVIWKFYLIFSISIFRFGTPCCHVTASLFKLELFWEYFSNLTKFLNHIYRFVN